MYVPCIVKLTRNENETVTHTSKEEPLEYPSEGSIDSHQVSKILSSRLFPDRLPSTEHVLWK